MYRRTMLTAACTAAFVFAGLESGLAATINTHQSWDGSQRVGEFGCPNTTTYGEVITAPKRATLNKFSFWWTNDNSGGGSMVVRAEVYAWDGKKATGSALWESDARNIAYGDSAFHEEKFKPGALPLTPKGKYVLFATIDKDFSQCKNNYLLDWGLVADTVYPKGTFVFQNNGGDSSQWTATPWDVYGADLVLIAAFQ